MTRNLLMTNLSIKFMSPYIFARYTVHGCGRKLTSPHLNGGDGLMVLRPKNPLERCSRK